MHTSISETDSQVLKYKTSVNWRKCVQFTVNKCVLREPLKVFDLVSIVDCGGDILVESMGQHNPRIRVFY